MLAVLETHQLTKRYRGNLALDSVTLSIPQGSVYALVGSNGAGKTTLIRLLMNMIPPSSGRATVLDVASTDITGREFERIGYVSENQELLDSMTVKSFLNYVRPFYSNWDASLETQLIEQLGLPLRRKLKHLSRGMKMKAALASVLPFHPAIIVLDEPLSGLDPLVRDELIESLKERRGETTIFLSSHDLAEIENFATHVGFLEQGRLLFSEDLPSLLNRFREVEITATTLVNDRVVSEAPSTWLNVQSQDGVIRFVHSQFEESTTPLELASAFPEGTGIAIQPMTLRSIFVNIARSGRKNTFGIGKDGSAA